MNIEKIFNITMGLASIVTIISFINNTINLVIFIFCCVFLIIFYFLFSGKYIKTGKKFKNHIEIDGIDMVALYHEFQIWKDIRNKTKNFEIYSVGYIYEFEGKNFTSIRTYRGTCISRYGDVVKFPLVLCGDKNSAFGDINCYVYDLLADPQKKIKKVPEPKNITGIYQLAYYFFSSPLKYKQEFEIEVHYTWPNCLSHVFDYVFASPIFYKKNFVCFNVEIRFYDKVPVRMKKFLMNGCKKVSEAGVIYKGATQKDQENYTSFTDNNIEMKDNLFFIFLFNFED